MAHKMIKRAVDRNYIQIQNGWTAKLLRSHMKKYAYKGFSGIHQNNMSQARKKFLCKNWYILL